MTMCWLISYCWQPRTRTDTRPSSHFSRICHPRSPLSLCPLSLSLPHSPPSVSTSNTRERARAHTHIHAHTNEPYFSSPRKSSSIHRCQSFDLFQRLLPASVTKRTLCALINIFLGGVRSTEAFGEGRGVKIETYWTRFKRIISSCGRLGHTKFGPVTGIPERHAYFKTTKQDRDRGAPGWEGRKLGKKLLSEEQLSLLGKTRARIKI